MRGICKPKEFTQFVDRGRHGHNLRDIQAHTGNRERHINKKTEHKTNYTYTWYGV